MYRTYFAESVVLLKVGCGEERSPQEITIVLTAEVPLERSNTFDYTILKDQFANLKDSYKRQEDLHDHFLQLLNHQDVYSIRVRTFKQKSLKIGVESFLSKLKWKSTLL